jgi:hypothetical protein
MFSGKERTGNMNAEWAYITITLPVSSFYVALKKGFH